MIIWTISDRECTSPMLQFYKAVGWGPCGNTNMKSAECITALSFTYLTRMGFSIGAEVKMHGEVGKAS